MIWQATPAAKPAPPALRRRTYAQALGGAWQASQPPVELFLVTAGARELVHCVRSDRARALAAVLKREGSARGRGGGLGPPVDERVFGNVLKAEGILSEDVVVVPVDCRGFADARASNRWHLGFEPQKVVDFVSSEQFPGWVTDLQAALLQGLQQAHARNSQVAVVFYCRSGCHRSVAASVVLRHILHEGVDRRMVTLTETMHMSKPLWQTQFCNECALCRRPSSTRSQALETAARVWRLCARELS